MEAFAGLDEAASQFAGEAARVFVSVCYDERNELRPLWLGGVALDLGQGPFERKVRGRFGNLSEHGPCAANSFSRHARSDRWGRSRR